MKIRERIAGLVMFRLEVINPHKEALRRALAILAHPQNLALAGRLGWRAADRMWRIAGDKATDFNQDRKSTRLNSSHANISYAVFCLKKKTNNIHRIVDIFLLIYSLHHDDLTHMSYVTPVDVRSSLIVIPVSLLQSYHSS